MKLFPEPIRKALDEGSIKAADVIHWPSAEHWEFCAQVVEAAPAEKTYPGRVKYRLFRNQAGRYVSVGEAEKDQLVFAEEVRDGRLFS